jgi:hypothetical protein
VAEDHVPRSADELHDARGNTGDGGFVHQTIVAIRVLWLATELAQSRVRLEEVPSKLTLLSRLVIRHVAKDVLYQERRSLDNARAPATGADVFYEEEDIHAGDGRVLRCPHGQPTCQLRGTAHSPGLGKVTRAWPQSLRQCQSEPAKTSSSAAFIGALAFGSGRCARAAMSRDRAGGTPSLRGLSTAAVASPRGRRGEALQRCERSPACRTRCAVPGSTALQGQVGCLARSCKSVESGWRRGPGRRLIDSQPLHLLVDHRAVV